MSDATRPIDRSRYRRITRFFGGVIVHVIWWDVLVGRVASGRVRGSRAARYQAIARRFRELAMDMGGVMIKAGQFLSSRMDVLPTYITDELAGLQDEVPPEPSDAMLAVIERELGSEPEALFARFDAEPQAAASLGQTHRARLFDDDGGHAVILKVQRPGIEVLVETDLAALRTVGRWLMFYPPIRRRADVPALIDEFARTTWDEIDYEAEAGNAERFAEMFADDPGVRIPAVHRRFSTRRVLTLEDVEHIKIRDFKAIEAAGVSRVEVARKVLDVYLRMVFEEGFFHADPHPGNLFVHPTGSASADGGGRTFEIVFVDFGMVGHVPPAVGEQLREILVAVALRDVHRLVVAFQRLDMFLPGADLDRVEHVTASALDRFWGQSVLEITHMDFSEMQAMALEFRDVIFEMPFQVPHDFIFLGRAVGILSGLSTSLDPQFNPWSPIEVYARRMLADERQRPGLRQGLEIVASVVQPLVLLPAQLERLLRQAERGELEVRLASDSPLQRDLQRVERAADRLLWGVVFMAFLLVGTLLYVADEPRMGIVGWALAGLALVLAVITGRR